MKKYFFETFSVSIFLVYLTFLVFSSNSNIFLTEKFSNAVSAEVQNSPPNTSTPQRKISEKGSDSNEAVKLPELLTDEYWYPNSIVNNDGYYSDKLPATTTTPSTVIMPSETTNITPIPSTEIIPSETTNITTDGSQLTMIATILNLYSQFIDFMTSIFSSIFELFSNNSGDINPTPDVTLEPTAIPVEPTPSVDSSTIPVEPTPGVEPTTIPIETTPSVESSNIPIETTPSAESSTIPIETAPSITPIVPLPSSEPTATNPTTDSNTNFEKMVWACYYPWYRTRNVFASNVLNEVLADYATLVKDVDDFWTNNKDLKDRPIGPPSMGGKGMISFDPKSLETQVEQAISAGIDGFEVYYEGAKSFHHGATVLLFEAVKKVSAAKGKPFYLSMHMSTQGTQGNSAGEGKDVDIMVQWSIDWITAFGNHPNTYKIDSRPIAIIYSTGLYTLDDWKYVTEKLKANNVNMFIVGDNGSSNDWDKFTQYFDGTIGRGISTEKGLERNKILSAQNPPKLWAGETKNGFDVSKRGEAKDGKYIDRRDGLALIETFDNAVSHNANWIRIVSWNEFYEHTHIEPSRAFGTKYFDIMRDKITKWKAMGQSVSK